MTGMTGSHWEDTDDQNDQDDLVAGFVSCFDEKKIQGLFKDFSRTNFPFFKDSNHSLEYMSFLVLPRHDCNFNFYPKGLSVFAPFRHLSIWVG